MNSIRYSLWLKHLAPSRSRVSIDTSVLLRPEMLMIETSNLVDTQAILKEVGGVTTQFDMFRLMKTVTEAFRMRAFIVFRLPEATDQKLQSASIISNWPSQMLAQYDAAHLLPHSEAVALLRRSTIPVKFDINQQLISPPDPKQEEIANLFRENGMLRGANLPVCDPSGGRGCVALGGDRPEPSDHEMLELHMICHPCVRPAFSDIPQRPPFRRRSNRS